MAAKILPNSKPFEDCTVYGPYYHIREKRHYVVIRHNITKSMTSSSYARYQLCIANGRLLSQEEEADHIDENRSNDSLDNLRILPPDENRERSRKGRNFVTLICANCGKEFSREKRQVKNTRPFCKRSCLHETLREPDTDINIFD